MTAILLKKGFKGCSKMKKDELIKFYNEVLEEEERIEKLYNRVVKGW